MSSKLLTDKLGRRKHEIVFQALMNVYYHENIENNSLKLLNWTAFITIIFSSTSFVLIADFVPTTFKFAKEIIFALLTFSITCLNSIVLAFGVSHKMMLHRDLKKKWLELYGSANQAEESTEKIENIECLYNDLNTLEPPANEKQLEIAYKKTCIKMGLDSVNQ